MLFILTFVVLIAYVKGYVKLVSPGCLGKRLYLTTIERFFDGEVDSTLSQIFNALSKSCIEISKEIASAPIYGITGLSGSENSSGDNQKTLDIISNSIIKKYLSQSEKVSIMASEEETDVIIVPGVLNGYMVTFDPLDGSSNIDCAIPTGTIFGVYPNIPIVNATEHNHLSDILQAGSHLVAAGYCMYSSSTEFVVTAGKGVHGFTLDPSSQTFVLTRPNMKCPARGPYYSLNEGRSSDWPDGLRQYISDIKDGKSAWGKRYSSRYVCSLVADVHRTILYGGWAGNPRSHLRLLYEAAPLAFVLEQAGGAGSDGMKRLLDIKPSTLHERLSCFLGSVDDIAELESYGDVQQLGFVRYDA